MKQEFISRFSTMKEDIHKLSEFILENKDDAKEIFDKIHRILKDNSFEIDEVKAEDNPFYLAYFIKPENEGLLICNFYEDGQHGSSLISSVSLYTAIALSKLKDSPVNIDILMNFKNINLDNAVETIENSSFIIAPSLNVKTYQGRDSDNCTLNRIFFHNLKEAGIIHIENYKGKCCSSNDVTPILRPVIGAVGDKDTVYPSSRFSSLTTSEKAEDIAFKAGVAIGLTFIDMESSPDLITESYLNNK